MFMLIDNLAMLSLASRMIFMLLMVELSLQTCDDWPPWSPSDCPRIVPDCPQERGFCVLPNGGDQNSAVIKLDDVDRDTTEKQEKCLSKCSSHPGATGCEVIWNQGNRGCYVHTQEVHRGNGVNNHACWIFSKCKILECPEEKGFCILPNGGDQNSGVIKLDGVDGNTPEQKRICLSKCMSHPRATGCEVIWNQGNRGCYVHTQEVDRGNGINNHACWIFSKCRETTMTTTTTTARRTSTLFKLIDVVKRHGVTYSGLKKAIYEAQCHLHQFPHSEVILHISSGLHKIPKLQHISLMNFTGPQPGKNGRFILQGEGVDKTVLEVDPSNQIIRGCDINRITVRNIQFRRSRPLVSQGVVKEVGKGFVVLDLEEGFPFISSFFDTTTNKGRFLRKYIKKDGDCQIVEFPGQVPWSTYTQLGQRLVKLHLKLKNPKSLPPYSPGDLLGVKGKCCGKGKSAYWICGADDVVFENVKFDRQSRGVIRCKVNNVRFTNIIILRENKGWCMSTPDGGPQIGQPKEIDGIRNVIVENLVAEHTGDDGVAFFNVKSGGVIRNSKITNSFARGILLYKSKTTILKNNVVEGCPVLRRPKD